MLSFVVSHAKRPRFELKPGALASERAALVEFGVEFGLHVNSRRAEAAAGRQRSLRPAQRQPQRRLPAARPRRLLQSGLGA